MVLQPTLEAVFNKLGQPLPLGYCNSGIVVAVGNGVTEFKVGDRVALMDNMPSMFVYLKTW